jgi:spore cortex formation protein SpoVR/YcgB (stage V sporulation)
MRDYNLTPTQDWHHYFSEIFKIRKIDSILEFGLGVGTKYLLDHCENLTSVELSKGDFNKFWCDKTKEELRDYKNLGLGEQKIFEVRKFYSDVTALNEFFTPEFCEKYEFFHYKRYPNGEMKIESRDHKVIKKSLIDMYSNGGLPDIRLVDPNHRNKGWFLLEHRYDGKELHDPYVKETMLSLYYLWQKPIILTTISNNKEIVYVCSGDTVSSMDRNDYESKGGW